MKLGITPIVIAPKLSPDDRIAKSARVIVPQCYFDEVQPEGCVLHRACRP